LNRVFRKTTIVQLSRMLTTYKTNGSVEIAIILTKILLMLQMILAKAVNLIDILILLILTKTSKIMIIVYTVEEANKNNKSRLFHKILMIGNVRDAWHGTL